MNVTFNNVTITIANAPSPYAAYDKLCDVLGAINVSYYETDEAVIELLDAEGAVYEVSTELLWPNNECTCEDGDGMVCRKCHDEGKVASPLTPTSACPPPLSSLPTLISLTEESPSS